MKNILIIGAGRRVQETILPALYCLGDQYVIQAVLSRSLKDIRCCDGQVSLRTVNTLSGLDFRRIDLIMVAVTTRHVPHVLRELSKFETSHAVLMLDTPITFSHLALSARHFRRFRRVLVSEDSIALPSYIVAKKIIDRGSIGKMKSIHFAHNGYKYHALASLRMLSGSALTRMTRMDIDGKEGKNIEFCNGLRAVLLEPRDYTNCHFLIQGTHGCITDNPAIRGPSVFFLEYECKGLMYRSLSVNGEAVEVNASDREYVTRIASDILNPSWMTGQKIHGLMTLIRESFFEVSAYHYSPWKTFEDYVAMRAVDGFGCYANPFAR